MKQKAQYLLLSVFIFVLGFCLLAAVKLDIFAKEPEVSPYVPYYKSVLLEDGDSLWKLAEKYSLGAPCTKEEYISELKAINGLSDDTIHTGCYLTVVYYEKSLGSPQAEQ